MIIPLSVLWNNEDVVVDNNMESLPDLLKQGISLARKSAKRARPVRSDVYVGAAVYDNNGHWFTSANIETKWQHSYHAEENAIVGSMLSGSNSLDIIIVSAEKKLFTPCGNCCDLVMEFSSNRCLFIHDNPATNVQTLIKAQQLMPHYPKS